MLCACSAALVHALLSSSCVVQKTTLVDLEDDSDLEGVRPCPSCSCIVCTLLRLLEEVSFGRRTGTLTAEAQMFLSSCMSVKTLQVKQTKDALHLVQPCQAANSRSSW